MALMRRSERAGGNGAPVSMLTRMRQDMDRMFDQFLEEGWPAGGFEALGGWSPAVEMKESDKSLVIKVEAPGVDPKEIDVSVSDHSLTISGEKKEEREESGETWHVQERSFGAFRRTIQLPPSADTSSVNADARSGVLTISIGKKKGAESRKIPVRGARD
jgi:HSP20 family protein